MLYILLKFSLEKLFVYVVFPQVLTMSDQDVKFMGHFWLILWMKLGKDLQTKVVNLNLGCLHCSLWEIMRKLVILFYSTRIIFFIKFVSRTKGSLWKIDRNKVWTS